MTRRIALIFVAALQLQQPTRLARGQCIDGYCLAPSVRPPGISAGWRTPKPAPLAGVAAELTRRLAAGSVRITNQQGPSRSIGSGAVVQQDGRRALVLTCGHLFREGIGSVSIHTGDGRAFAARVLGVDAAWDIAAVLTSCWDAPAIPLAKTPPVARERLAYCGFGPDGRFACGGGNLLGYVRMQGTSSAETLQLSGAARQGDSGGPIVNSQGEIVGLIVGTDGRVVIGPSCRPIAAFLARFRRLFTESAPQTPPVTPPAGDSISGGGAGNPQDPGKPPAAAGPDAPARGDRSSAIPLAPISDGRLGGNDRVPGDRERAAGQDSPPARARDGSADRSVQGVATPSAQISNLKSAIISLLLPALLAALGISVPPTCVLLGVHAIRCLRRRARRRRRKRAPRRRTDADSGARNGAQQPIELERKLNDDYARELAGVFAYDGRSPLQDATLGREFSREIDRAAESSDTKLATWANSLRDRVLTRFYRIHGWTPAPAEPTE